MVLNGTSFCNDVRQTLSMAVVYPQHLRFLFWTEVPSLSLDLQAGIGEE